MRLMPSPVLGMDAPLEFESPCCGAMIRAHVTLAMKSTRFVQWSLCACLRDAAELRDWATECGHRERRRQDRLDAERAYQRNLSATVDRWFPLWSESPRSQRQTFDSFRVNSSHQAEAKARVENWGAAYGPDVERGLYIMGPVGTGKSHLASALVHMLREMPVGCGFVKVPRILARLRETYDSAGRGEEQSIEQALVKVPVLVLDDLGVERPTDWALEKLFLLLDARYELCRPVVATTNWKPKDLQKTVGERLVSRLVEMCDLVMLTGADYRVSRARGNDV